MTVYQDDSLALHTDLYEINMMKAYWDAGRADQRAIFEVYFREEPFENGFAIFAGLERVIDYLDQLHFTEADIAYLREAEHYPEAFLDYLKEYQFTATVRSMVEGELCFANEPLMQIEGKLADLQLVETAILNAINFQTLIATKAARVRTVAPHDSLSEFGSRRAQEMDAAIWGARAAYIGGFDSTSNVRAGKVLGVPISGTHAHALVQAFRSDYEAFKAYAASHKDCVFLVDTYDVLNSGVPNAIRVADELGDKINFVGIRIDSGDITYLSKRVREMLDKAGYPDAIIVASSDLDEKTILNLKMQGAKVDSWGVGTRLITGYDQPALGAVYKLVAIENEAGDMVPTMKISSSPAKTTTPGRKQIWRITRGSDGKSEGDYVALEEETLDTNQELFMFHPTYTYINKTVKNYKARPLLQTIFKEGTLVYQKPTLAEVKAYATDRLDELWDEYKRILNPARYPVDLSQALYDLKMENIHGIHQMVKNFVKANQAEKEHDHA